MADEGRVTSRMQRLRTVNQMQVFLSTETVRVFPSGGSWLFPVLLLSVLRGVLFIGWQPFTRMGDFHYIRYRWEIQAVIVNFPCCFFCVFYRGKGKGHEKFKNTLEIQPSGKKCGRNSAF